MCQCALVRRRRGDWSSVDIDSITYGTENNSAAVMLGEQVFDVSLDEVHLRRLPRRCADGEFSEELYRLLRGKARPVHHTIRSREKTVLACDVALVDLVAGDESVAGAPLVGEKPTQKEECFVAARCRIEPGQRSEPHRVGAGGGLHVRGIDDVGILNAENCVRSVDAAGRRDGYGKRSDDQWRAKE